MIDATPVVMDVHQNHDYSHHQVDTEGNWTNLERQRNLEMAGGRQHLFIIKDRTEVLTPSGLRRTRDWWRLWRSLRTSPVLHPGMPWVPRLAIKALNTAIDYGHSLIVGIRLQRQGTGPWNG